MEKVSSSPFGGSPARFAGASARRVGRQFKKYLTPKNIGVFSIVGIIIIIVILSILAKPKEQAPLVRKVECIRTPGSGKQTYNILQDKPGKLQIAQVDVDPIDVGEGETQTIRVMVKDKGKNATTTGTTISANIFTDNKYTAATAFALRQDADSKDGSSIWESSWTRDDSVCRTYMETITATNDKGDEAKVDLSFK